MYRRERERGKAIQIEQTDAARGAERECVWRVGGGGAQRERGGSRDRQAKRGENQGERKQGRDKVRNIVIKEPIL